MGMASIEAGQIKIGEQVTVECDLWMVESNETLTIEGPTSDGRSIVARLSPSNEVILSQTTKVNVVKSSDTIA